MFQQIPGTTAVHNLNDHFVQMVCVGSGVNHISWFHYLESIRHQSPISKLSCLCMYLCMFVCQYLTSNSA
jgi:hypothetical protein